MIYSLLNKTLTVTLTCSGTVPGNTTPPSDASFHQILLYQMDLKATTDTLTSITILFDIMTRQDILWDAVFFVHGGMEVMTAIKVRDGAIL